MVEMGEGSSVSAILQFSRSVGILYSALALVSLVLHYLIYA